MSRLAASQEGVWIQLAAEVGGEFYRHGGSTHKVVAQAGSWEIVLDTISGNRPMNAWFRLMMRCSISANTKYLAPL